MFSKTVILSAAEESQKRRDTFDCTRSAHFAQYDNKGMCAFLYFFRKCIDKCESIAYNICKEANLIERLVVGNVPTLQQGSYCSLFFLFIPT